MFEYIALILAGFAAGMLFYEFGIPDEEKKIEQLPVIREEKKIVTAYAVCDIPMEELKNPVSKKWIEENIKYELANQIWNYARVTVEVNQMAMVHRYKAELRVVDMGRLNPFLEVDDG